MRFDPTDPQHPEADRFVLSKGHGAPILYAAWAEAGCSRATDLLNLRKITSDLEGHPTPRLPFVDVATGSLGQGLAAGVGIALNARRIKSDYRTYVLLGDGESAEGSVWEAAEVAANQKLDNLCAITDVNGLGQSRQTQWDHDICRRSRRAGTRSAGTPSRSTVTTSPRSSHALDEARKTKGRPTMIVAGTVKGKGVSIFEGKEGWHGKALKKGAELDQALAELNSQIVQDVRPRAGDSEAGQPPRRRAAAGVRDRCCPRPRTSLASWSRRARRTARRSRRSAPSIGASSRSTPTSATPPSARSSSTRTRTGSTRSSSPSR